MLKLSQRTLLRTGESLVNVELAAKTLLETGNLPDHIRVVDSRDAEEYEFRYTTTITGSMDDPVVSPKYPHVPEDHELLLDLLVQSRRDDTNDDDHFNRLAEELEFFESEEHLDLLLSIKSLVDSFKSNGIVWGVGRGSSCASYVLYLLEVHDINPILYEINFSEFSKQ